MIHVNVDKWPLDQEVGETLNWRISADIKLARKCEKVWKIIHVVVIFFASWILEEKYNFRIPSKLFVRFSPQLAQIIFRPCWQFVFQKISQTICE